MQTVAAQVFDVPVVVPRPAQYVALGGAVQAAWVLTGSRPNWEVPVQAELPVDTRPQIRAQYAEAAASVDSQRPPRPGH